MTSFAWNFFQKVANTRDAKCDICGNLRKYKDEKQKGTTGSLIRHLADHGIDKDNYQSKCNSFFFKAMVH